MRSLTTLAAVGLMAGASASYLGLFGSDLTGSRSDSAVRTLIFVDERLPSGSPTPSAPIEVRSAPVTVAAIAPASLSQSGARAASVAIVPSGEPILLPAPSPTPTRPFAMPLPERSPVVRVAGYLKELPAEGFAMPLPERSPGKLQRIAAVASAEAADATGAGEPAYPTPKTEPSAEPEAVEEVPPAVTREPAPASRKGRSTTAKATPAVSTVSRQAVPVAKSAPLVRQATRSVRRKTAQLRHRAPAARRPVGILHSCSFFGCTRTLVYRHPRSFRQFQAHRNRVIANAIRRNRARMGLIF